MPAFIISLLIGIGCGIVYDKVKDARHRRIVKQQIENAMEFNRLCELYNEMMEKIRNESAVKSSQHK